MAVDVAAIELDGVGHMISVVVPTRNREHTLRRVARSYFEQECVSEIIFVDDGGADNTVAFVRSLGSGFPDVNLVTISNPARRGASACRNQGVDAARNDFICFVDDDEYLEQGYAKICLEKLKASGAGAVSGRRIYMRGEETQQEALRRFQTGLRNSKPFNRWICEYNNGARYSGDIEMPLTNAIIVTTRSLLQRYRFDEFYNKGNGYREESDFQMNLFLSGKPIVVTNAVHSFHLPTSAVTTGGQRTSRLKRVYWSVYFTRHFYRKYFDGYRDKVGLRIGRRQALVVFAVFCVYREFIKPYLYALLLLSRRVSRSAA